MAEMNDCASILEVDSHFFKNLEMRESEKKIGKDNSVNSCVLFDFTH